MLRLSASKIQLNARDLNWHRERLERRRSARTQVHLSSNFAAQQVGRSSQKPPQLTTWNPRWSQDVTGADALISHHSVPLNLPSFWEKILVDAGVTRVCNSDAGDEQYEDEKLEDKELHEYDDEDQIAEKPKNESRTEENADQTQLLPQYDQVDQEVFHESKDESRRVPNTRYQSDENGNINTVDLSASTRSAESLISVDERLKLANVKDGSESMRAKLSRHRRSIFSFRSKKRDQKNREDSSRHPRTLSSPQGSLDDGTSEANIEDDAHEKEKSILLIDDADDASSVRQESRRVSVQSRVQIDDLIFATERLSIFPRINTTEVHSSEYAHLSPIDRIRSRSGTISRSPFHKFYRAISGSPDKISAAANSPLSSSSPSPFLSRPSHHPLPRNTSSPHKPRIDQFHNLTPTRSMRRRNCSPLAVVPPSSPSQSLSPFSLPHSTPRNDPPLPLLPPPFSTTPRRPSATLPNVPPASPTSPLNPSPFHNLTHFRLFTPPPVTRERPAGGTTATVATAVAYAIPRTPRGAIRVFDDGAPIGTQPRTPAGLPRHGVVADGGLAGARTAPPTQTTSWTRSWGRRVRRRDRGSPESSRRRGIWNEDQENM